MPQDQSDAYRSIVTYYDLEHDGFEDDLPPIVELANQFEDPVLEMGCGTGRVLQALVERGLRATGVDLSQPMLDAAVRRLQALPDGALATVHVADMRTIEGLRPRSFGIAAYTLNALMHLADADDQLHSLRAAREMLVEDGVVYIDVMHPHPEQLTHLGGGVILEGSWPMGGGVTVDKWSHRAIRAADQIIETDIWYDVIAGSGELKRHRTSFDHRYVYANELRLMLHVAGYRDITLYGSYDLDPFEDESDRLIAVARR